MNPNETNQDSALVPESQPMSVPALTPATAPISDSVPVQTPQPAQVPVITPTASNLNPALPPTYTQMLQEMGKQLNARKSLLFKRVLRIIWPGLLFIVFLYIGDEMHARGMFEGLSAAAEIGIMIAGGAYLLFAIIYMWATGFLFEIEKRIWIDSHFDRKDLTPKQSWGIAKKLFWPGFLLRLRIAWQYYLLPALVIAAVLAGIGYSLHNSSAAATYQSNVWILSAMLFAAFLLIWIVYSYYVKVKIRYSWFVFLDLYKGKPFDTRVVLSQMNALNTASKSASFRKALVTEIGTDSANVIADMAVGAIGFGISQVPGVGKVLGELTRAYGKELTRQAASLGKISAMYLLYRFARKELFGSEQVSNDHIYGLIK